VFEIVTVSIIHSGTISVVGWAKDVSMDWNGTRGYRKLAHSSNTLSDY
jgi:hypothetical protein